jgi:small subunit ribosomal protein S2
MPKKKTAEKKEKAVKKAVKTKEKKAGEVKKKKTEKITKKQLKEKAKKLAEKIKVEDIKEKLKELRRKEKEKEKTLVPLTDYLKSGVHIGTKVITPHMRPYVYRRRNDGIAVINTNLIDKKLKEMADLLSGYKPEDFIVVCKREAGWHAVEKFSELTGVRVFTRKYPAGILTNPSLPNFFETEMVFICDPWLDKNALNDAKKIKKKIFALCDTNNYTFDIEFFAPCNNKSTKSLGFIFYLLAKEYSKARGIKTKINEEDFFEKE